MNSVPQKQQLNIYRNFPRTSHAIKPDLGDKFLRICKAINYIKVKHTEIQIELSIIHNIAGRVNLC